MNKKKLLLNIVNAFFISFISISFAASDPRAPSFSSHLPTAYPNAIPNPPINLFFILDDSGSMVFNMPYIAKNKYVVPPDTNGEERVFDVPYPRGYVKNRVSRTEGNFNSKILERVKGCSGVTDKEKLNCQIWYSFYSTRALAMQSALLISMNNKDIDDWRLGWGTITPKGYVNGRFHKENIQDILPVKSLSTKRNDFFNWVTGLRFPFGTGTEAGFLKILEEVKNGRGSLDPFNVDGEILSCTQNYAVLLTDGISNSSKAIKGDNLNKSSLIHVGSNFRINTNKGLNYDAWNITNDHPNYNGRLEFPKNLEGRNFFTKDKDILNAISVNDIAFKYWYEDLRPDLIDDVAKHINTDIEIINRVPYAKVVNPESKDKDSGLNVKAEWHYKNDYANWQRINTYTIALGSSPTIPLDPKGIYNLYTKKESWPANTITSSGFLAGSIKGSMNDIAQAGYVGRGGFYSVSAGHELVDAFNNIRDDIASKKETRVSSSSVAKPSSANGSLSAWYFTTTTDIETKSSKLNAHKTFSGSVEDFDSCFPNAVDNKNHFAGSFCEKNSSESEGSINFWDIAEVPDYKYKNDSNLQIPIEGNPFSEEENTSFWKNRYLITSKPINNSFKTVIFDKKNLSERQLLDLTPINGGSADNLISYIYGDPTAEETLGWLKRTVNGKRNIFDDISRSKVLYVGQVSYPKESFVNEGTKLWEYTVNKDNVEHSLSASEAKSIIDIILNMYSDMLSYYPPVGENISGTTEMCMVDYFNVWAALYNKADDICDYLVGISNSLGDALGVDKGFYKPPLSSLDDSIGGISANELFFTKELPKNTKSIPKKPCTYKSFAGTAKITDSGRPCNNSNANEGNGAYRLVEVIDKYLIETENSNYKDSTCNKEAIKNIIDQLNNGLDITLAIGYERCNNNFSSKSEDSIEAPVIGDVPIIRREMAYILTNGGQLHGFDTNTGVEVFSYVPSSLFTNIKNRVVGKSNKPVFDGNITAIETYTNKNISGKRITIARTVLVGGFGTGRKGLFALDVTTPENPIVLWEKVEDDDSDNALGHIIQKPTPIQLPDGKWVVLIASGVGHYSKNSSLFVLDIETGEEIQEITVPGSVGLNELSPIVLREKKGAIYSSYEEGRITEDEYFSMNLEQRNRPDRVYSGDLFGQVWAFEAPFEINPRGNIKTTEFSIDKHGKENETPIFIAFDRNGEKQAITTQIEVTKHPVKRGYMLYFGTGDMFDIDPIYKNQDTLYGVWDDVENNFDVVERYDLREISFIEKNDITGKETREIFGNLTRINWDYEKGWAMDTGFGERVWQKPEPIITAERESGMIFTMTFVDIDNDTKRLGCKIKDKEGVYSWRMAFLTSGPMLGVGDFYISPDDKDTIELVEPLKKEGSILPSGSILTDNARAIKRRASGRLIKDGKPCSSAISYVETDKGDIISKSTCLPPKITSWREF